MSIQTVLGSIKPEELGRTLTHEHMCMEFAAFYREPPALLKNKFGKPITLADVGYLRQYPYSSQYNLVFNDAETKQAVLNDVEFFAKSGGGAIVENTTVGLGRNLQLLKEASQKSGVHIIAGTGHYVALTQNKTTLALSKEKLYDHMLAELVSGCVDNENVKAGFIGEVASVWPLEDFEKRAIVASGEVQGQVGCGVSFHPHRTPEAPFEIIRLYLEAGGSASKVVMSHLDRTLLNDERLPEFAKLGTYCQFDLFGTEVSYYQLNSSTDMPSDAQRLDKIKLLIKEGFGDRILMSHDIHTKHRLADFGGHGYAHILNNVVPKMLIKGISQNQIDDILIKNPAQWLKF